METFNKLQENNKELISKGKINFRKTPKDRISVSYVETRLEALENQWQSFCDIHRQIITEIGKNELETSSYYKNSIYDQTENLYFDYKTELRDVLNTLKTKVKSVAETSVVANIKETSNCFVKLPEISIPKFSGKYSEWTSFKDLFTSLIHNNIKLDNVQKLHYLKGHLSGEAEQLLRHVPITEKNYDVCWTQLTNRYDNKKYLSNNILRRFMSQKYLQYESSNAIKELLDNMNECLSALQNIGVDVSNWDIIVIYIFSQKLDPESRKQWELKSNETEGLPTLTAFREFLEHKFRSLEFLDTKHIISKPCNARKAINVAQVESSNNANFNNTNLNCQYCKANHKLINCKDFAKADYEARHSFIQTSRLCFNCFSPNHSVYSCRKTTRCRVCKRKHHSLLHPPNVVQSMESAESKDKGVVVSSATTSEGVTKVDTCYSNSCSQVLLATAIVEVESRTGSIGLIYRCLLDQSSQASFITESAVQALGLKKIPNKIHISGIGCRNESLASMSVVEIKLKSIHNPQFTLVVKAHVLSKLTSFLPSKKVNVQLWPELTSLKLADPKFDVPNKIDLLLGAEVYGQILVKGLIKGPPGCPVAQNTQLGWILSGQIHSGQSQSSESCQGNTIVVSMHTQCNDNDLLRKFWELEDVPIKKKMLTEDEQKCEEIFYNTVTRDECGRYIVKLPFRDVNPVCKKGNFREIAAKRLYQLEKRLSKNTEFKEQYAQVINEYLHLNHMELVPEEQRDKSDVVYLPHHAVVRNDKVTSKVRVVFDASCSGTNGVSLNNDLLVGPSLQNTLRHIVMRWRKHPICLVADIVKMYRQVKVNLEDADEFQRILWRDESGTIQHYRMLRVTFGIASAPYLAVRVLQQVTYDEGVNHPAAVEKIINDFYMDDLMTGCQTVEECLKIKNEISSILGKGGFQLQKWASNSKEFMEKIGQRKEEKESRIKIGAGKESEAIQKVLGLTWNSSTDEIEYSVQLPQLEFPVTKRKVISDISRLFDPLGWIAPTIITSKIFIQKLWISGIDWDHELPPHLLQEWLTYRSDLAKLNHFRIPRWMHTNVDDKEVELHGFSDASNQAYAAVVYTRIIDKNNEVHVNLVTSKTKVSPIKQVSIPRLELCGAQLLAKLILEVSEILEIPKEKIHAWTDSSVVLAWLSSHPSKWKTFVANRTSEILTILDRSQWAHVKSKDNPADCASRGVKDYENLSLWKHGPSWLSEFTINYSPQEEGQVTKLEERDKRLCHTVNSIELEEELFTRFSTLRKLIRTIVYLRRYFKWLHSSLKIVFPSYLTSLELNKALEKCIIYFQKKFFACEIESIIKIKSVTKKSKLVSLNPFIDSNGLLRVGGRLQNAELSDDMKHPILIPRNSHLAQLIIADAHERTLHGGPQLMFSFIRTKYWIVDAKNLVKLYVRKCVTCIRHAPPSNQPIMGQLPASRVTAVRPFRQTGVDYAGPIAIRTTKGRGHRSTKGYICLFICMATKAIHLEAVSDMTSEGFIAAFKRMVARRGHVSDLWSDNGSNFVGAEKENKNLLLKERSSVSMEIANWLSDNGTTWHRIPPYTPHFGGLWEAGIKSTKHHLKRAIGNSTLTFEELSTVFSQIEACLNSRPLTTLSDDAQDPFPLTPGHFLVGEPLLLVPGDNYEKSTIASLRRWQLVQRMTQYFWRRWSNEYLSHFLHRYRWNRHSPEPKIGDVALVKEENLPPARWLYGIIVDKHTGQDNVTRVVSLKCNGIVIKRPISKICILPVNN
ncbi:uncharacterized protein LOC123663070 [Melitaea cinxia]|uniref:uncharacterized protein LOC123663070 n=1 Tax=Melitaea cinxia TaxID=113334 RepID=UPI001E26F854|nr:uncharacterized protein LOC123663070 [Melitaea cinxia]